jgi:murein DD-endopeptidase MepM/ murein hydrolase activator NlpD
MPFPIAFVPTDCFFTGGRRFGADRDHGKRKHAACDLIAPVGTEIHAIRDGVVVLEAGTPFYHGTRSLAVRHQGGIIVRYCEIQKAADGIRLGSSVRSGQVIAYVGKMFHLSMLHFELYSGTGRGPLTDRSNKPFQRRNDLIDPTALLKSLMLEMPGSTPVGGTGGLGVGSSYGGGVFV